MRNAPIPPASLQAYRGQTAEAFTQLEKIVVDGLRHGFFECSITCEIVNGGKRQLVLRAGKSYQFNIRQDEVPR